MNKLICFYENDLFIVSENYQVHLCPPDQSIKNFLNEIEKKYFNSLKIIQCNFEYDFESSQTPLYDGNKAAVFVLHEHQLQKLDGVAKEVQHQFKALVSRENFIENVRLIKNEIAKGRLYQVNLTAPLVAECHDDALNIFNFYQHKFKSQYKALLPFQKYSIISFSPELFLERINSKLITRPIKGSSSATDDFSKSLYQNEKEQAELSMIVDLLRNDLNSLDEKHGSVVTKHRAKLQLDYIQHTYSEIQVENNQPLSEVLEKTMPGGSISGCPKKESLLLINQLEPYRRQAYTGTLGWWRQNDFSLNLTIRSFINTSRQLIYHAGCGIVFDSKPENEWHEFLLKTGQLNVQS